MISQCRSGFLRAICLLFSFPKSPQSLVGKIQNAVGFQRRGNWRCQINRDQKRQNFIVFPQGCGKSHVVKLWGCGQKCRNRTVGWGQSDEGRGCWFCCSARPQPHFQSHGEQSAFPMCNLQTNMRTQGGHGSSRILELNWADALRSSLEM